MFSFDELERLKIMNQYITDAKVKNGHLSIANVPFKEDMEVKVIVIPKINFNELSFLKTRELTKNIHGNISDDITSEREQS